MKLHKRISRTDWVRRIACYIGHLYMRLVFSSTRWTRIGFDNLDRLWVSERPFVIAFWHGRMLMMPFCWERRGPFYMLISSHPDGQLISRTIGYFGLDTVAGSSTRGGLEAVKTMLRHLKQGECIGITPDGPHGPRMRASAGIIRIARTAGVPILPVTFSTTRRVIAGSWDRFVVALPFARGVLLWGEPFHVARDADPEAACRELEAVMNAMVAEADGLCGVDTIEPGALPAPVV